MQLDALEVMLRGTTLETRDVLLSQKNQREENSGHLVTPLRDRESEEPGE